VKIKNLGQEILLCRQGEATFVRVTNWNLAFMGGCKFTNFRRKK